MRNAIQRDPKVMQGGANSIHLRDPPKGYENPLDREHPVMSDGSLLE
jgi:hypothetical protein